MFFIFTENDAKNDAKKDAKKDTKKDNKSDKNLGRKRKSCNDVDSTDKSRDTSKRVTASKSDPLTRLLLVIPRRSKKKEVPEIMSLFYKRL